MVPEHLVWIVICNTWRTIVRVIVVCRLFETCRDWCLGRIDIQEHHVRITLLDCVWILVTLGLVILPIIPCHTNAWSCSHFHWSWKSVIVNMVNIRLYVSYFAWFAGHNIHLELFSNPLFFHEVLRSFRFPFGIESLSEAKGQILFTMFPLSLRDRFWFNLS